MRLNQFEMIAALESCSSLSEVAEKLFISQPSISKGIQEFEDEIGYEILKRTKNGVEFTEQGKQVLVYVKEILGCIDKIKKLNTGVNNQFAGTISVGIAKLWGSEIFAKVFMGLKEQYPNLVLRFYEGCSADIIEQVAVGQLEYGVIMMYSTDQSFLQNLIEQNTLQYEHLFSDRVCLYVGKKHPLCGQNEIMMEHVVQYPYITSGNSMITTYSERLLQSYGYQKNIEIVSNQRLLLQYLLTQDAFTSMPERIYQESEENRKHLKQLFVQDLSWHCQVGVVYRAREWSPLENLVLKRLQERLKG